MNKLEKELAGIIETQNTVKNWRKKIDYKKLGKEDKLKNRATNLQKTFICNEYGFVEYCEASPKV